MATKTTKTASSRKSDEQEVPAQPSLKARAKKKVTAEEIKKANELMMKAWDMISHRQNSEVDV